LWAFFPSFVEGVFTSGNTPQVFPGSLFLALVEPSRTLFNNKDVYDGKTSSPCGVFFLPTVMVLLGFPQSISGPDKPTYLFEFPPFPWRRLLFPSLLPFGGRGNPLFFPALLRYGRQFRLFSRWSFFSFWAFSPPFFPLFEFRRKSYPPFLFTPFELSRTRASPSPH